MKETIIDPPHSSFSKPLSATMGRPTAKKKGSNSTAPKSAATATTKTKEANPATAVETSEKFKPARLHEFEAWMTSAGISLDSTLITLTQVSTFGVGLKNFT